MAELQTTLKELDPKHPDFEDDCKSIIEGFVHKKVTILDIVLRLQDHFANQDMNVQVEGMDILTKIIEMLPLSLVNEKEIAQFLKFYGAQFIHLYKLLPNLLRGILALSQYDHPMQPPGFTEILRALFDNVSCQAHNDTLRLQIFRIYQNVLRTRTSEILDMGPDFVYAVISAIDGEKNPANLVFLFKWLPEFIATVKLGHLTEEMYNAIECYFPMDFRVSSEFAMGIARDELADGLMHCLCASPAFAEWTIPLLFNKLDADVHVAKVDSLQLLRYSCKKFDIDVYITNATLVWSSLHKELLKCTSSDLESLLLDTVTNVARKITANEMHLNEVLFKIEETTIANLNVTEKFYPHTWKFFLAIAKANAICAKKILQLIEPRLMNMFNITATSEHKLVIFDTLIEYIRVGNIHAANVEAIPNFLFANLGQQDELRIRSLNALPHIGDQFDDARSAVFNHCTVLLTARLSEGVSKGLHECIVHYSKRNREEIFAAIDRIDVNHSNFDVFIDHLSRLSSDEAFVQLFITYISNNILEHRKSCVHALHIALELNAALYNALLESEIFSNHIVNMEDHQDDAEDLLIVKEIIMAVMASCTVEQQAEILEKHLPGYINYEHPPNMYCYYSLIVNVHIENLPEQEILFELFLYALTGDPLSTELLANLLNKIPESDELDEWLAKYEAYVIESLGNNDDELLDGMRTFVIWLTKSLFMRGHKDKRQWLTLWMVIEGKTAADVDVDAARIVMRDDCPALSMRAHVRRKALYKQEFFVAMCQVLDNMIAAANDTNRKALALFAVLVEEAPMVILRMYFEKFMRLVILLLDDGTYPQGIVTILGAMAVVIETKEILAEKYLSEWLTRLMHLAVNNPAMRVRIRALQCIGGYVSAGAVASHQLMPHKESVISALRVCIDDRKRLVRKAAVDARLRWFLLGAPI